MAPANGHLRWAARRLPSAPGRNGGHLSPVAQMFGRDTAPDHVKVGFGVHPLGDARLVDDFSTVTVDIHARAFHIYQAEWTPEHVAFFIDGHLVKTVHQSPSYPMQLMLSIYEFAADTVPEPTTGTYPKQFVVDYVWGFRRTS